MQVEQTDSSIKDSTFRLEQSERERLSLKDKLKGEMLETKKFQEMISRLSNTIKQQDGELRHLRSQASDGRLSELNSKVGDLSLQLSTQSKVLANYDSENSLKSQIIMTMSQEKETLKQNLSRLVKHIDEVNTQNQKLILANNTLAEQLECEYKKYIALMQEKPFPICDSAAGKDWGETISDITMLELHNNQINSEKISTVYKSSYQSDINQPCISKDITKCTEQTSHIIARSVSCKTLK
jgi:hypothetical protein